MQKEKATFCQKAETALPVAEGPINELRRKHMMYH